MGGVEHTRSLLPWLVRVSLAMPLERCWPAAAGDDTRPCSLQWARKSTSGRRSASEGRKGTVGMLDVAVAAAAAVLFASEVPALPAMSAVTPTFAGEVCQPQQSIFIPMRRPAARFVAAVGVWGWWWWMLWWASAFAASRSHCSPANCSNLTKLTSGCSGELADEVPQVFVGRRMLWWML